MKWIIILSMFVSCNALKTLTDGDTKVPIDFNTGLCNVGNCEDSLYYNLVSFWSFDETNKGGDTRGDNHLSETGSVFSTIASTRGVAIDCTASSAINRYSNTGVSGLNFGTSQDFSISFWIAMPSGGTQYLIDFQTGSATPFAVYLNSGGFVTLQHSGTSTVTTVIPSTNAWDHITINVSRSTGMSLYLNGVFVESHSIATNSFNFDVIQINLCSEYLSTPSAQYFFNGNLDSIGIWNRTLNSAEVQKLYDGNVLY